MEDHLVPPYGEALAGRKNMARRVPSAKHKVRKYLACEACCTTSQTGSHVNDDRHIGEVRLERHQGTDVVVGGPDMQHDEEQVLGACLAAVSELAIDGGEVDQHAWAKLSTVEERLLSKYWEGR